MSENGKAREAILLDQITDLQSEVEQLKSSEEQRRRVESELRQTVDGLRALTEDSLAGIYIIQDGRLQYANPALSRILGYEIEELIGEKIPGTLAHPDDREKVAELIRRRVDGEVDSLQYSLRVVRKDGSVIECEVLGRVVERDGRPAIFGTMLDVTEREEARQALIESEALFRGVAEKAPDLMLIVQRERVIYANPAAENLLGLRLRELSDPDFNFFQIVEDEWVGVLRGKFTEQSTGTEVEAYEYQVRDSDGKVHELLQNTRLINYRGELAHLLIATDITERKRADREREDLLRSEHEQYMLAQSLAQVGLSLSADLELTTLMNLICLQSTRLFGAGATFVWLVEGMEIVGFAGHGADRDRFIGQRLPLSSRSSLAGRVIREKRPLFANRAKSSSLVNQAINHEFNAEALLGVPLVIGDRSIGALIVLEQSDPNRFTEKDLEMANVLGSQLAVAVENAQLIEETQVRLKRETALKEAAGIFASTLNVDTILSYLARQLCECVEATSTYICDYDMQDKTSKVLAEYYAVDASAEEQVSDLGATYDLEETFPGSVVYLEAREPIVTHIDDPDLSQTERAHMLEYGGATTLMIPLEVAGQVTAYAEIWETRHTRNFSADEVEMCHAIAQQAAIAIESGRHYEQAQIEISDRKQAQEALRQSEERYRAVAESANTGIVIADPESRLSYVNPAFAELIGYMVQELEGKSLSELMDAEQYSLMLEQQEGRQMGERGQYELILDHGDGRNLNVLVSAAPLFGAENEFQGILAVITDITSLKEAQNALSMAIATMKESLERTRELAETEEALRDSAAALSGTLNPEEVLDSILENVGRVVPHDTADIMLLLDSGDGKSELEPVRERGYEERGLKEWLFNHRFPWKDMQNFRRMARTGRPVSISDTRAYPGWIDVPETSWIRSYAGAPLKRKGTAIGFLNLSSVHPGFYQQVHAERLQAFADQAAAAIENAQLYARASNEIEERRRVENELRQSETRYRAVAESALAGIAVIDPRFNLTYVNPAYADLLGYEVHHILGRSLKDIMDPRAWVEAIGKSTTGSPQYEMQLHRKGGEPLQVLFSIADLDTDEDSDFGALVVVTDITERDRIEQAERDLVRMKEEFILSASHSLRTPVHTLSGFLELLQSGKPIDPQRQAEFLANATESAQKISELVEDLLDTVHMEDAKASLRVDTLELDELIRLSLAPMREIAIQQEVELEYEPTGPGHMVEVDSRRLSRAIGELVENAVRYSEPGRAVSIVASNSNDHVEVQIRDQGPGIELSQLHSLTPDRDTAYVPSTGLGLYIVNTIVSAHGGRLTVDSELGKGSVFVIRIPHMNRS